MRRFDRDNRPLKNHLAIIMSGLAVDGQFMPPETPVASESIVNPTPKKQRMLPAIFCCLKRRSKKSGADGEELAIGALQNRRSSITASASAAATPVPTPPLAQSTALSLQPKIVAPPNVDSGGPSSGVFPPAAPLAAEVGVPDRPAETIQGPAESAPSGVFQGPLKHISTQALREHYEALNPKEGVPINMAMLRALNRAWEDVDDPADSLEARNAKIEKVAAEARYKNTAAYREYAAAKNIYSEEYEDKVDPNEPRMVDAGLCAHGTNFHSALSALAHGGFLLPSRQRTKRGATATTGENWSDEHTRYRNWNEAAKNRANQRYISTVMLRYLTSEFDEVITYADSASKDQAEGGYLIRALPTDLENRHGFHENIYQKLSEIPTVIIGDGRGGRTYVSSGVSNEIMYRTVKIRMLAVPERYVEDIRILLRDTGNGEIPVVAIEQLRSFDNARLRIPLLYRGAMTYQQLLALSQST